MKTKVYVERGFSREYIGYIENGKIYMNRNKILEEHVANYDRGKIFNEKLFFDDHIALYDDKFFYFPTRFDKKAVAYLENGKILEEEYPNKCIGLYEGYANPACIALLLCNFDIYEKKEEYKRDSTYYESTISNRSKKNNDLNGTKEKSDSDDLFIFFAIVFIVVILIIGWFMFYVLQNVISSDVIAIILGVAIFIYAMGN